MDESPMPYRSRIMGQLAGKLARADPGEPLPVRLCRACVDILHVDGAAITLATTRLERITLCASNEMASRLEDLQETQGEGPSASSYDSGQPRHLAIAGAGDLSMVRLSESAFDLFGAFTLDAIPIRPRADVLGVLTVHRLGLHPNLPDPGGAQLLANAVGVALSITDEDASTSPFEDPWSSRDGVHQATGMVAAQLHISPSDALAVLRAHAYAHDTTLAVISDEVIGRRLDFSTTDPDPRDDRP